MKLLLGTLCALALFAAAHALSSSWGQRGKTDVLLLRETVVRSAVFGTIQKANVIFPKNGQVNNKVITAVSVIDSFPNGRGAYAFLLSGGPGWTSANINLSSQMSYGISSTVEIWGKNN